MTGNYVKILQRSLPLPFKLPKGCQRDNEESSIAINIYIFRQSALRGSADIGL